MRNQSTISQKQNRLPLDRRLSLKFSSAANTKNNPRMSIPMRRDSMVSNFNHNVSSFNMNNDYSKDYRHSLVSNTSNISRQSNKSNILSNLVRKLDHQEQLKQIIQSKIKNSENYQITESSVNGEYLETTLKYYQKQVQCLKDIISELVTKINVLQGNKTSASPLDSQVFLKKRQQYGTQTQNYSHDSQKLLNSSKYESADGSDFMDNLDKTLKVLSTKKNQ